MGYQGEKASLNQASSLYEYIKKNVTEDLRDIFISERNREKKIKEHKFFYEPKKQILNIPLLSFDGGITTLYEGHLSETCILKIAGACPPEFSSFFKEEELKEIIFHTFSGKVGYTNKSKNSEEESLDLILKTELKRLNSVEEFKTMLSVFNLSPESFEEKFIALINRWDDKTTIKDTFRELLEWSLIVDFLNNRKNNDKDIPFLIIKDGNISSNPKAVTGAIAEEIKKLLTGNNSKIPIPFLVGAVKSSRYTGDSTFGKFMHKFTRYMTKNCFFRLPPEYEALLDSKFSEKPFDRFFLSLFGGKSVFEIQIPTVLSKNNDERLKTILDLIASQITFNYGGSIVTNSFAHKRASIAAADGKLLEEKIRIELNKEIDTDE